jgi:hypothetical protein
VVFTARDGSPLLMAAGLWDEWKNRETGERLKSCTMIVTEPDDFAAEIRDRMPVFLMEEHFAPWLGAPNGAIFWRSLTTAMAVPRQSSPAKSPSNIGMTSSATPPSATQSWTASFTMLTAFNSPEKACESRRHAIKLLTSSQTPEPITMSVEAAAHDRAKSLLTIKRNERSPSREIAAHNQRNVQLFAHSDMMHAPFRGAECQTQKTSVKTQSSHPRQRYPSILWKGWRHAHGIKS